MSQVDLDSSVGYLLKQAATALHTAMDAVLRPLDLTVSKYSCLEVLAHRPGISNSELARATFVTRQSMNVMLQALVRDGLVTRPELAPTGRILPVELTPLGRERLDAASSTVAAVESRMHSTLSPADHSRLRELLRECIGALS